MVWRSGPQGALAPSLCALVDQADAAWPDRSTVSDGSLGDPAHAARKSDHNPDGSGDVLAVDLTEDYDHGPDLEAFWSHLITTRDPRVRYLIYEGRIVKSYTDGAGRPAWVPQPYDGISPHAQHIHVSVLDTDEAKGDLSPWFPLSEEDVMPALTDEEQRRLLANVDILKQQIVEQIKPQTDRLYFIHKAVDETAWAVTDPEAGIRAMVARGLVNDLTDEALSEVAKAVNDELARRQAG